MRNNGPVTQQEFIVPSERKLVSTTDLKGRILHCNEAFIEVSGFSAAELLGQPHNLIRHPDMPAEAFRDLWATLAEGLPWTGIVKNRRKNGDHYWVRANVTPVRDGAAVVAYLSVRTPASREDIRSAEALYPRLRQPQSPRHRKQPSCPLRLRHGQLHRAGLPGALVAARSAAANQARSLGWVLVAAGGWAANAWLPTGPGLAAALGLALLAGWASRALRHRRLQPLLAFARQMAAADLSAGPSHMTAPASEPALADLGMALNQLNVNLQAIVGDLRAQARHLSESVDELASGNTQLSARTSAQASSLEQTAASLQDITGAVRQQAMQARQATLQASQARDDTRQGNHCVSALMQDMAAIDAASRKIGEFIALIDGISFQSNLLALNASVEAARAGDSGRGFAVVAAEVRAMSKRTQGASDEIKSLIEHAVGTVSTGVSRVRDAEQRMDAVLTQVVEVTDAIQAMEQASGQELDSIAQINAAMSHIDGVTQDNAAMVEELATCAQGLRARAQSLLDAAAVFKLDGAPASTPRQYERQS